MADEGIFSSALKRPLDVTSFGATRITGVADDDMPTVRTLMKVWRQRYPRNLIRTGYYGAKEGFKDFGISIPDRIKANVSACIGWPAKAVRSLADLTVFDGWVYANGTDPYGLDELTDLNALELAIPQTVVSAYTHGCAFLTLTGDPDTGDLLVTPRSAEWSAAIWDGRRNRLAAALTINDDTSKGRVTAFNVFLPGVVYQIVRDSYGSWAAERYETHWPEPTAVPLISDPQLSKPLGTSRVTRPVMALTDMDFRTLVRMEASAEFYAVPKLWFLGMDEDAFSADTWSSLVSAINAISKDEDGDNPTLQQISQASMQPHSDMLKTIALVVASDTDLPVDSLGITLDNPSSAEAMAAAERKLTRRADRQNRLFGMQLTRLARMAVCLSDGLAEPPDELKRVKPAWAPTREISDGARADAYVKISQVNQSYATSEVGLRRLGLDGSEIRSLRSQQSRDRGRDTLDMIPRSANAGDDQGSEPAENEPTGGGQAREA